MLKIHRRRGNRQKRSETQTPWRSESLESTPFFKPADQQLPDEEYWTPEELIELFGPDAVRTPEESLARNLPIHMPKAAIIDLQLVFAEIAIERGSAPFDCMSVETAREILSLPEDQRRQRAWDHYKEQMRNHVPEPIPVVARNRARPSAAPIPSQA